MQRTRFSALALTAVTLAAAGCGGSQETKSHGGASTRSSSTTGQAGATRSVSAGFIARADAICARTNAELYASPVTKAQGYAIVAPQYAVYFRTETAELSKLTPPTPMANDWRQIVGGFQMVSEDLAKVGENLQKHAAKAAGSLFTAANTTREHIIAIAARDGFKDCARAHR